MEVCVNTSTHINSYSTTQPLVRLDTTITHNHNIVVPKDVKELMESSLPLPPNSKQYTEENLPVTTTMMISAVPQAMLVAHQQAQCSAVHSLSSFSSTWYPPSRATLTPSQSPSHAHLWRGYLCIHSLSQHTKHNRVYTWMHTCTRTHTHTHTHAHTHAHTHTIYPIQPIQ